MQRNEELERSNLKLQAKVEKHRNHGDNYSSRNDGGFGSGSYDENERSFNNDNSFSQAKAEASGNRAIIDSLQEEKAQMQMMLVTEEQKAMDNEREIQRLRADLSDANAQSRELSGKLTETELRVTDL